MASQCYVSAQDYATHFHSKGALVSYECWRREVELGRMSESGEPLEHSRSPRIRLYDTWMKCWVILHGSLRQTDLVPIGRYSRTEP